MDDVIEIMESILDDRMVPRNIRSRVEEAIEKVKLNNITTLSEAIYILDDISNDVNMPEHTRTDIWQIISMIEEEKEKTK